MALLTLAWLAFTWLHRTVTVSVLLPTSVPLLFAGLLIRVLLLALLALLALLRRRIAVLRLVRVVSLGRRLLRRSARVNFERLPLRDRLVGPLWPRVDGDGPILENTARTCSERLGNECCCAAEVEPWLPDEQVASGPDLPPLHPGVNPDDRESEVWVDRLHPHRDRGIRRHPQHLFSWDLDRHLRRQIRKHLDQVFEPADHILFRAVRTGRPWPIDESVAAEPGGSSLGIQLKRDRRLARRALGPRQCQRHVLPVVTPEVDGGVVERPVRLRHDGHPRPLHTANVSLPGDRLALAAHVLRVVVSQFPNHQGRGVDDDQANAVAAVISGQNHQVDAMIKPPFRIGQDDRPHTTGRQRHRHPPRGGRGIDRPVVPQRRDNEHRPLL